MSRNGVAKRARVLVEREARWHHIHGVVLAPHARAVLRAAVAAVDVEPMDPALHTQDRGDLTVEHGALATLAHEVRRRSVEERLMVHAPVHLLFNRSLDRQAVEVTEQVPPPIAPCGSRPRAMIIHSPLPCVL